MVIVLPTPLRRLSRISTDFMQFQRNVSINVSLGSLADIQGADRHVRFTPKREHAQHRHQCLLCANSKHRRSRWSRFLNRPFNDPSIDAMSKHWNLSQEQEIAAARLTREAVEMLTTAAERGGVEIENVVPFVQRLIDAHFLKLEPGVHGRAVVRITEDGLSALLFKRHLPRG